jgi:uncharacterized protein YndB with AHSA1/START domain
MTNHGAVDVVNEGRTVRATADITGVAPPQALRAFTDPDLVRQWWAGGALTARLEPGGEYVVRFDALGQTMRGSITAYDPEGTLAFTWAWDHEPDEPGCVVSISVGETDGGSRIDLSQGIYEDSEAGRVTATSHEEGWAYFLPRLVACF